MSAILGIVAFDGRPADVARLDAMTSALAWPGVRQVRRRDLGSAAFATAATASVPGDQHDRSPEVLVDSRWLVTAEGRLDNRDEVRVALGLDAADAATLADAAIIARAFGHWGEACPRHLLGDWSLAAWSAHARRLFLARDHHGNTSLFLSRLPDGQVVFASDASVLHAAGASRRIDEPHLARLLIGEMADSGLGTIRADVQRVPPAHACLATADATVCTRFWDPLDVPSLGTRSLAEYGEGLRSVLDTAVRDRCRATGPVGVTLSGGLDSGAVAALAARVLAADGRGLRAYTHAPSLDAAAVVDAAHLSDESALARATVAHVGITQHRLVTGAGRSPIASLRRALAVAGQPLTLVGNIIWVQELLEAAADDGVRVLLTGQSGNATASWRGLGPGVTLIGRARRDGARGVARHVLPLWLQRERARRHRLAEGWPDSAIDPQFAARVDLAERLAHDIGRDPVRLAARASTRQRRVAALQPGFSHGGAVWNVQGAGSGLDVRDPMADVRVIEYAFAVPPVAYRAADGTDRLPMRTATSGLLPDQVRWNRALGRQGADLTGRLRASADEVEAAIEQVAAGPAAAYVSTERLRWAWSRVLGPPDPTVSHTTGTILLGGLMAGLWIDGLER